MDPDIEPMAGGGESLIGDDWCSLCTHKCSAHHAEIDALRARIAELEARLSLAEKVVEAAMVVVSCEACCDICRENISGALAAWRAQK